MHQELSPRQREVVALVAEGKTNAQIALQTRPDRGDGEELPGQRDAQGRSG